MGISFRIRDTHGRASWKFAMCLLGLGLTISVRNDVRAVAGVDRPTEVLREELVQPREQRVLVLLGQVDPIDRILVRLARRCAPYRGRRRLCASSGPRASCDDGWGRWAIGGAFIVAGLRWGSFGVGIPVCGLERYAGWDALDTPDTGTWCSFTWYVGL
jgi:hypothetical protein